MRDGDCGSFRAEPVASDFRSSRLDDNVVDAVHLIQAAGAASEAKAVAGLQSKGAEPDIGKDVARIAGRH